MTTVWVPTWPATPASWSQPWHYGLSLPSARRTVEPTALPLDVAYVRNQVLRTSNGSYEDAFIEQLIQAATAMAEHDTGEALMPQTWQVVLSGFPSAGIIRLPHPPLVSVDAIEYVDADGTTQTLLGGSPETFLVKPSGAVALAEVASLTDTTWPTPRAQADAVTITFQAGYASADLVPAPIRMGMCVLIAELYKQRSLSVQNTIQNVPAVLQLERFWKPRPAWI